MKDTLELIKKYGATAVLLAWLFHTNMRVNKLEEKLFRCLENDKYNNYSQRPSEAVLPKKISYEAKSNT